MTAYRWNRMCAAAALCAVMGGEAAAAGPFALVTGRRDPALTVIDLGKALLPGNHATANAVISRVRVTPDVDTNGDGVPDTPAAGLPSNIVSPRRGYRGPDVGAPALEAVHSNRAWVSLEVALQVCVSLRGVLRPDG